MLKKNYLLSILLAFCLCFAMAIPALAAENDNIEVTKKTIEINGYSFDITEEFDPATYTVTKTYVNKSSDSLGLIKKQSNDLDKAKALLIAMGFDNESIELWNDETLLLIANGKNLSTSVSYYEVNDIDNTSKNIPANVAIEKANKLSEKQWQNFIEQSNNSQKDNIEPYKNGTYEDSYIRVFHSVSYQGSGKYLFSTDSLWLTMPFFRGYDSIGSCAQLTAVITDKHSGYYSYDQTYIEDGKTKTTHFSETNFSNSGPDSNEGWSGAAGVFQLPPDGSNEGVSIINNNFRAHYQYLGIMNYPDIKNQNFNSKGTYAHTTLRLSFTPSIGIKSGSIGVNVSTPVDYFSAWVTENYSGK